MYREVLGGAPSRSWPLALDVIVSGSFIGLRFRRWILVAVLLVVGGHPFIIVIVTVG